MKNALMGPRIAPRPPKYSILPLESFGRKLPNLLNFVFYVLNTMPETKNNEKCSYGPHIAPRPPKYSILPSESFGRKLSNLLNFVFYVLNTISETKNNEKCSYGPPHSSQAPKIFNFVLGIFRKKTFELA
jgi:hypothetical protein